MRDAFLTVLVEPNALFREGLARILHSARFRIISSAPTYSDASFDPRCKQEDLLLVVGSGGDGLDTVAQVRQFKEKYSLGRVAVVADNYRASEVLSAFKAGANAYFVRSTPCEAFVKSLDLVMRGETLVPGEVVPDLIQRATAKVGTSLAETDQIVSSPAKHRHLSAQERRILRYLVDGESNKAIARKMDIAEATVKVHIKAILRKIQVHNRTQAAIWAMHNPVSHPTLGEEVSESVAAPNGSTYGTPHPRRGGAPPNEQQ